MEAYGKFAQVYDLFMDNIDYESWAAYVEKHLKARGIEDGLVLELGCGTGTMTGLLAQKGYDMIGVDNSEEMLAEAMKKKMETGQDILYLLQDSLLLKEQQILQALQKNSFPIQMKQELFTETLTVSRW